MTKPSVPITERRYAVPLILVTSLFFCGPSAST